MKENESKTQKPIRSIKSGNVSVSVFESEKGYKNYNFQISFKDKDSDEWINKSVSIMENEIDRALAVLKAIRMIDLTS